MEEHDIDCPYCGEVINVLVDSSDVGQEYYEDCSVCCCPILFKAALGIDHKNISLLVKRDDE